MDIEISTESSLSDDEIQVIRLSKNYSLLTDDKKIIFGYFNQSNNKLYEIENIYSNLSLYRTNCMKIRRKGDFLLYELNLNIPIMIYSKLNDVYSICFIFKYSPKIKENEKTLIDYKFIERMNIRDNLINLDSYYKTFFISGINYIEFLNLQTNLFYYNNHKSLYEISNFEISTAEEYYNLIDIQRFNFENDFYNYVKICENIKNNHFRNYSINLSNNLNSYNSKKIDNYIKFKSIQISPYFMYFKRTHYNQTSRFLRKYFENDNFIKVEFINEYYDKLFTNNNSTEELNKLYSLICQKGIMISNRMYIFFFSTTNNIRSNSMWFVDQSYLNDKSISVSNIYEEFGLSNIIKSNITVSKVIARMSQHFSGSIESTDELNIGYIDDIIMNGYCFTDGCGKISLSLMKKLCHKFNKGLKSSAVQIRYQGSKGVLMVDESLNENNIELTASMKKFECTNFNNLELVRFADYSQGYLNLQIIVLLIINGIKPKILLRYAKKEISNIKSLSIKNINNIINKITYDINFYYHNESVRDTVLNCYIYNKLANMSSKFKLKIKKSAFLMGVPDFKGYLNEGEVFIQIYRNNKIKRLKGNVLITKNPCLSKFDIHPAICIDLSDEFYRINLINVIVFSTKGKIPLPFMISNSDLDGDIFWICWEDIICKNFKNEQFSKKHTYVDEKKLIKKSFEYQPVTIDNFQKQQIEFFTFYQSNYKLDLINNLNKANACDMLKLCNYSQFINSSQLMINNEYLALYNSIEVDFCKNGETTQFAYKLDKIFVPTFLKKTKNVGYCDYFKILKEKLIDQENPYKYLISISKKIEYKDKYMNIFQYKDKINESKIRSALFLIYSMISFESYIHKTFLDHIFISSEIFFDEKIKQKKFNIDITNLTSEIILKIKEVINKYNNEILDVLKENEILFDAEVLYLLNIRTPRTELFHKDIDEWRRGIMFRIKNLIKHSLNALNQIKYSNISDIIFILIYWKKDEDVYINGNKTNIFSLYIDEQNYKIINIESFFNNILSKKYPHIMREFYYSHLKIISFYDIYLGNISI